MIDTEGNNGMGSTGRRWVALAATAGVVMSPLAFTAAPAQADPRDGAKIHLVRTSTSAAEKWLADAYEGTDTGDYVDPNQITEPALGPLGAGARFFNMGAFSVQTELYRTSALDGAKVRDIALLDYSTWAKATGSRQGTEPTDKQPVYLRLSISSDGSGTKDTTLNFEPASNGTVKQNTWQDWATAGGRWHVIEGPGVTADSFITLAEYLAAKPDATLAKDTKGGLSIVGGMAGANQTYAKLGFDRIAAEVGDQTYLWDLEPEQGGLVDMSPTPIQHAIDGEWNSSAFDSAGNGGAGAATPVRQQIVFGPGKPLDGGGKGSVQIEIGDNSDATQFLRNTYLDGKPVDRIRGLRYDTYAKHVGGAGSALQQPVYLRLSISSNGSGTKDTTLNFEPADNADQGAVQNGVWQRWNAFDGKFRVVEGPGEKAESLITLAAYMARHKDAIFAENAKDFGGKGALSFVVGGGGDNQRNGRFAIDNVIVNKAATTASGIGPDRSYGFEPAYTVPTVRSTYRTGAGEATLTGTAGAGDKVEIRELKGTADWATVVGTATAGANGTWSLKIPNVSGKKIVRAYLAGTYGTADIVSNNARVDVVFGTKIVVSTKGGLPTAR
jgi:hypothetical protein